MYVSYVPYTLWEGGLHPPPHEPAQGFFLLNKKVIFLAELNSVEIN